MLQRARNITRTSFFKVTSLNAVNVGVKIAGGLLASKMIAIFIGPSGMALMGNLRNLLSSVDTFATLGFQNGIIKYVAEYEADEHKLRKFLTTLFITVIVSVILCSAALLLFTGPLCDYIFPLNPEYAWVIKILAFILPLYTGNLIFMAVLTGLGDYRKVIGVTIWGNASGVLYSALLIWQMGLEGAFLALITAPVLQMVVAYYLLQKRFPRLLFLAKDHFDSSFLKGLLSYSLMSLATAVLGAFILLNIRNSILIDQGAEEAGYWEAMNRISTFYMLFATTLLSVYYLPRLSAAGERAETSVIIRGYYKHLVPLFALGLGVLFIIKHYVVRLTLSPDFEPTEVLFKWQLAGDFLKVCSMILAYQFFARKMTTAYIVSEMLSFAALFFFAKTLIPVYGTEGAVMAHLFTYALYLAGLLVYFRKTVFGRAVQA